MVDSDRDRSAGCTSFAGDAAAGIVLLELSVVELRHRAVLAVLAGESITSVAARVGASDQSRQKRLAALGTTVSGVCGTGLCAHRQGRGLVEMAVSVHDYPRLSPPWSDSTTRAIDIRAEPRSHRGGSVHG